MKKEEYISSARVDGSITLAGSKKKNQLIYKKEKISTLFINLKALFDRNDKIVEMFENKRNE